ncbi:hypothetical protein V8D89_012141 [Ganoderma adspersum]
MDLEILDAPPPIPAMSKVTVSQRKRKQKPKGGKSGNPTIFISSRYEYLGQFLDDFVNLRSKNRFAQNQFWDKFFAGYGYWENLPWFVLFDQEPPEDAGLLVEPSEGLDPRGLLEQKGDIIDKTTFRATCAIAEPARHTTEQSPWAAILRELAEQVTSAPAARKSTLAQMSMGKYKARVDAEFRRRWPTAGLADAYRLSFRWRWRMEEMMEAEKAFLASEELAQGNIVPEFSRDDGGHLAAVIGFIRKKMGFYMTLFTGFPNAEGLREFQLKVIIAGKTGGSIALPWHVVEPEVFETQVVVLFTEGAHSRDAFAGLKAVGFSQPAISQASTPTLSKLDLPKGLEANSRRTPVQKTKLPVVTLPNLKARWVHKSHVHCSRRKATEDDEDKLPEDEAEYNGGDEEEEDELEEEEEDGDDGKLEHDSTPAVSRLLLFSCEVPAGGKIPMLAELNMPEAVRPFLDRLKPEVRCQQLYWYGVSTEYERGCIAAQILGSELRRSLGLGNRAPLKSKSVAGRKPKAKAKGKGKELLRKEMPSPTPNSPLSRALDTAVGSSPGPSLLTPSEASAMTDGVTELALRIQSALHTPLMVTQQTASASAAVPQELASTPVGENGTATVNPSAAFTMTPAAQDSLPSLATPSVLLTAAPAPAPLNPGRPSSEGLQDQDGSPAESTVSLPWMLEEEGWPGWVKEMYNWMHGSQEVLGSDFMCAAGWWTVLERAYSWETSPKGYSTRHRPEQISHWLRVLQADVDKVPVIGSVEAYARC